MIDTKTIEQKLIEHNFCYHTDGIAFGMFVCKLCGYRFMGLSSEWVSPGHKNIPCVECGMESADPKGLIREETLEL